jgi:hypothetical protein
MEIIEPAVISLTVPNKDYVHAVEACFSITQLKVDSDSLLPRTAVAEICHRHLSPSVTMIISSLTGS